MSIQGRRLDLGRAAVDSQYWFRETIAAGDLDGDGVPEPFNTTSAVSVDFQ